MKKITSAKLKVIEKILIQIAFIIFIVEMLVMKILPLIPLEMSPFEEAVLDSLFLTIFSTPFIYWFVIQPFIKENENILSKISHMAYHDPLTNLANRRLLTEYIDKELQFHLKNNANGAIILIDLDGFKDINDTHGHLAGDHLLVEVANRLKTVTRDTDLVSRIGGDEFVILVKEFDADALIAEEKSLIFTQKILESIVEPIHFDNVVLSVNASIGIRIFNSIQIGFESLLREADHAMYTSKKTGKGKATVYQHSDSL